MFENLKMFVEMDYDYDGYGSINRVLVGPCKLSYHALSKEWESSWQPRPYTRKGVTRMTKKTYPVIGFHDWLIKDKGFFILDSTQVETI